MWRSCMVSQKARLLSRCERGEALQLQLVALVYPQLAAHSEGTPRVRGRHRQHPAPGVRLQSRAPGFPSVFPHVLQQFPRQLSKPTQPPSQRSDVMPTGTLQEDLKPDMALLQTRTYQSLQICPP